jgi:hypothetical protein
LRIREERIRPVSDALEPYIHRFTSEKNRLMKDATCLLECRGYCPSWLVTFRILIERHLELSTKMRKDKISAGPPLGE